ncbi:hypothetical protein D3C86_2072370 [compost metagenome]
MQTWDGVTAMRTSPKISTITDGTEKELPIPTRLRISGAARITCPIHSLYKAEVISVCGMRRLVTHSLRLSMRN